MEKLQFENFRVRGGRPILNGSAAVQFYYVSYLMFVLGATVAVAAIVR